MSNAFKIIPHYTYNEWKLWEGKWELIDGLPFAMSPAPLPRHQRIAAELRTELTVALRKTGCKHCHAYDPIDYKISEDTILQPDILIVCGNIKKPYLDFPPALVVEILSPSTALKDRNTKFYIYEQEKVKHYLIVDTDKEKIEVYDLSGSFYKLRKEDNEPYSFELDNDCSITVDLSQIWQ
ncbi:Uma2 family endonuclease [Foetidibacter luteolus]|uniref:Uma2 family endonuclease n=1 Tax=Foetidibacter luteolus TaxID=2608880 RepID=UPI00129B6629|nr:Uma2 family endonuclease [Foetidibacter luteolus]